MPGRFGVISPRDWGLAPGTGGGDLAAAAGTTPADVEARIRANLYEWLPRHLDPERRAFFGYYRATDGFREPPQTANLIASWELMAGFDRYGDASLLDRALDALDFYWRTFVVAHPMSVVAGGARDGVAGQETWTKFTAELVLGAVALHARSGKQEWLDRAEQSGRFLLQAARHGFSPKYRLDLGSWVDPGHGWDSFGRAIEACCALEDATADRAWRDLAVRWAEHALEIRADDGCFHLIDAEYYNTDLAADEIRGLLVLGERTRDARFTRAGLAFADWHLRMQRPDGAWAMTWDTDGNCVVPIVGPGDVPNIAVALLAAHRVGGDARYLDAASRAFRYSLASQVLPGSDDPYAKDPNAAGGFWSWDPRYDFTLSPDQATHHVRGFMFLLDYRREPGLPA